MPFYQHLQARPTLGARPCRRDQPQILSGRVSEHDFGATPENPSTLDRQLRVTLSRRAVKASFRVECPALSMRYIHYRMASRKAVYPMTTEPVDHPLKPVEDHRAANPGT